jgi:hypothetical protein
MSHCVFNKFYGINWTIPLRYNEIIGTIQKFEDLSGTPYYPQDVLDIIYKNNN